MNASRRPDAGEVGRYLLVGSLNTAIGLLLYWAALPWLGAVPAYALSFCIAVLTGYAMHSRWVFRQRWHWRALGRFPLVQGLNLLLGTAVVAALVHGLRVPAALAPFGALVLTVPLGFVLARRAVMPRD